HTRSKRDWSSDVCSSDLPFVDVFGLQQDVFLSVESLCMRHLVCLSRSRSITECTGKTYKLFNMPEGHVIHRLAHTFNRDFRGMRSEERRVGKEYRDQ